MANLFLALPVSAANGSGTAVDVSGMGAIKTIDCQGVWTGTNQPPIVTIEYNNDPGQGGSWASIISFYAGTGLITVNVACKWMRANIQVYRGGQAPVIGIGSTDEGATFATLVAPADNESGAGVDTTSLPPFKTIQVGGPFTGALIIEASEDGGTTWGTVASFSAPGGQTLSFVAAQMRVTRTGVPLVGPGIPPLITVGACPIGGAVADGITIIGEGTRSSPFVAVASAETTIYFNVKAYGAVGNGTTNDTADIQSCIDAAATVGGGVAYFPNAGPSYGIAKNGASWCLNLPGNVSMLGQSVEGAVLFMLAGQAASVRPVQCGGADYYISNITVDGNSANQTVDEHRAGIFLNGPSRVVISQVEIRFNTGDGIDVFADSTDIDMDDCYIHNNGRDGVAIDGPGSTRIYLENSRLTNNASGFHIEPTGSVSNMSEIVIASTYMDATSGNEGCELLGAADNSRLSNVVVRDCTIVNGFLAELANGILVSGCTITSSDTAATPVPAVKIASSGTNITVDDCNITLTASAASTRAVWLAGQTSTVLSNISIINSTINVQNNADGIDIQTLVNAEISGNTILGNSTMTSGNYGINIFNKAATAIDWVVANDNYIADFPIGIVVQASAGTEHVKALVANMNLFEAVTPGVMTACMSLDLDNRHVLQQATCIGNDQIGVGTMFATYPHVPMLIGGNRGGGGVYSCAGSPSGVINDVQGSTAYQRDASTASTVAWVNFGGGTGGWHSLNAT